MSFVCSPLFTNEGPKGTGAFRIDFNAAARTFTVYSGTAPGGPWFGTTQTLSLDTLTLPPLTISSLRVGLWGRQWTSQVRAFVFAFPRVFVGRRAW